jgi:hypothetical protein
LITKLLPPISSLVPKKKFRGKKRYFNEVIASANQFTPDFEEDSWYDAWHYHADWDGYGNIGWSYRKRYIEALCIIFNKFARGVSNYKLEHQLWIGLDCNNASMDATFFHTPAPNQHPFPLKFKGVTWEANANLRTFLQILIPYPLEIGEYQEKDLHSVLIYSPTVGIPI